MIRTSELQEKEVINIVNGQRLGNIIDIDLDLSAAQIKGVVIPQQAGFFKLFAANDDVYISWDKVYRIGDDVILVKLNGNGEFKNKEELLEEY